MLGTASLCQEQQRDRTEAGKGHKVLERGCLPQSSWQAENRALNCIFLSLAPLGLLLKYFLKYPLQIAAAAQHKGLQVPGLQNRASYKHPHPEFLYDLDRLKKKKKKQEGIFIKFHLVLSRQESSVTWGPHCSGK